MAVGQTLQCDGPRADEPVTGGQHHQHPFFRAQFEAQFDGHVDRLAQHRTTSAPPFNIISMISAALTSLISAPVPVPDLLRQQRRRLHVQPRGGARELAFFGNGKKVAQVSEFHRSLGICREYGNRI